MRGLNYINFHALDEWGGAFLCLFGGTAIFSMCSVKAEQANSMKIARLDS